MSVHDSRTGRAAADPKNLDQDLDRTASVFAEPARQQAVNGHGETLNRTSSIFEWTTRQQAAKNQGETLNRTSSIFERARRRQAAENEAKGVTSRPPTLPTTDDTTKHQDPFEPRTNPSPRERRLHGNQGEVALRAQRSAVGPLEAERDRLHMFSSTEDAQLIGRTLASKYTIESVIGTGSMGTIYRARQIALDKWVSIKILHQELAEQRNFVERFKLEAFSASRLEHPNSLRVLDFGEDGNLLYLVMEYVEADDLLTIMQREWPFHEARIVQIMSQALAGLAKAHEAGIVHRDIKPENILILRGTDDEGNATDIVKVCDFGIAKMAGPSAPQSRPFAHHLTTEGLVVGTPDYMSPEQARGDGVDGRSDLYSMGVVLYHLLSGRAPFIADTPFGIAIQHVSEHPPPPSRHRAAVNPHLESICLRAMNKRPEDRFQTAREMRRALLASLASSAESEMTSPDRTPTRILPFPACSDAEASTALVVQHLPSTPSWPDWARRPNAIVAAVALATLALAAVLSLFRSQDSAWGSGNVVRTATVALAPAAQPNAASSKGSEPALAQPPSPPPSLGPADTHPLGAATSELRALPATAPSPALGVRSSR
jgi:serine/threonine protein kinase